MMTLTDQIPKPPVDMVMSPYYDLIFGANIFVLGVVIIWTAREAFKSKRALPLLIMGGAAIASLLECIFDVMVLVWWPQHGPAPEYRILNISVPMWMLAAYPWYIGGMGYYAYRGFCNGMSVAGLWKLYFFGWLANFALEMPPLQIGNIYAYYGNQPFRVLDFPLWMAMTNSLMPILAGALLFSLDGLLKGPRSLFALALVPMAVGSAEIATGWPIWLALNSGSGYAVTYAAGFAVLGLSLMTTYLISQKFCLVAERRSAIPARSGQTELLNQNLI
jgi:hypothetical protein